jgi:hypothetical protein
MTIRAKFRVDERAERVNGGKVILSPVIDGSEENKKFFLYTPYGKIEMGTVNEDAIKEFTPGREFYIDFTPAEKND